MDGGEFLQTSHLPEAKHGPLSSSADFCSKDRAETVPPITNRFMTDFDATFMQ